MKNLLVFTMFIFLSCGLKDAKEYPLPTTIEFAVDKTIKVEEETEDFILTVTEKQFVASVSIGDTVVFTVSERTLIPVLGEIYEKTFATRKKEFFLSPRWRLGQSTGWSMPPSRQSCVVYTQI